MAKRKKSIRGENGERQLLITFCKSPQYPPEGSNLVEYDCDELRYYWPTNPNAFMTGMVTPSPIGFSCLRHDTGECKQFLIYQLISIDYRFDFERTMNKYRKDSAKALTKMANAANNTTTQTTPEQQMNGQEFG